MSFPDKFYPALFNAYLT